MLSFLSGCNDGTLPSPHTSRATARFPVILLSILAVYSRKVADRSLVGLFDADHFS